MGQDSDGVKSSCSAIKPTVEADSRRQPRGRRGALAAPPARPESGERSPEAQGPRKRAKVLHQTTGGASLQPQMPQDPHWHSQRPLPPPQRPALGGEGSPVHEAPRAAPQAGSPQAGPPGEKAPGRFWHPAVPDGSSYTLQRRQETRGCEQHAKFASCSPGPFIPLRLSSLLLLVPNLGRPRDKQIRQGRAVRAPVRSAGLVIKMPGDFARLRLALPAARLSAPPCSGSASPLPAALHLAGSSGSRGPGCH